MSNKTDDIKGAALREAILVSLRAGGTRTAAFGAAGMGRTKFYEILKTDLGYLADVVQAEHEAINTVEDALFINATRCDDRGKYNTTAQIFFLINRSRGAWKDTKHIEHGGELNITARERVLQDLISGGEGAHGGEPA